MRCATLAAVGLVLGCSQAPPRPGTPAPPLALPEGGAEFAHYQRTTDPIPGSGGRILLTIDDITRGQVMVSISTDAGEPLLGPLSVWNGESIGFAVNGHEYTLTLQDLRNQLIGEDQAVFRISSGRPAAPGLAEHERIEGLIAAIEGLQGAVFVRNGREHTGREAAEHLRAKWRWARPQVRTAEDFIAVVANASSETGEPYRIRFADGTEMLSVEFLLRQLERGAAGGKRP